MTPQLKCCDIFLPSGLLTLNSGCVELPLQIFCNTSVENICYSQSSALEILFNKHTPVSIELELLNYLNADLAILKENLLNLLNVATK